MDILGLPGELVALVLGWLLGLLSLPLGDAIRRGRERGELVTAIKAEMVELRYTMALLAHTMKEATGGLDDAFLAWLEGTVAAYTGSDPDQARFLGGLRQLRAKLAGATPPTKHPATTGMNLKTYSLPFLNSQVQRLSICSIRFQQQVLQIKAQLDLLSSETEFLMKQFDLTFNPSLDANNRAAVKGNLQSGYAKVGRSAVHIADLIAGLEALSPI